MGSGGRPTRAWEGVRTEGAGAAASAVAATGGRRTAVAPGAGAAMGRALPVELHALMALPLRPLPAGLVAAFLLALPPAVAWALSGSPGEGTGILGSLPASLWAGLWLALLIPYGPTASRLVVAATGTDLAGLRPAAGALQPMDEREWLAVDLRALRRSRVAGGVAVALAFVFLALQTARLPGFEAAWLRSPGFWLSEWSWVWLHLPLLLWIVGRGITFQLLGTRQTLDFARDELRLDLLDRRPLAVYGRFALRWSLVWIVGLSLGTLMLAPGIHQQPALTLVVLGAVLAVGAASFVLPVRGVRRRLRALKEGELARVHEALGVLRARRESGATPPPGLESDLLAWRRFVAESSDWPFDPPTVSRFLLYLLIPVGSWVCGALVERGLDRVLE